MPAPLSSRGWVFAMLLSLAGVAHAGEPPLHERIDALIDAAAVGPIAPSCSDADFIRRVYLDLAGCIPTIAETRAFLADPATDKRAKLIDRLLASPQYARHLSITWDVMLIERRTDKNSNARDWEQYLRQSFAANKPLDQLCRELLTADGSDEALRPAARFFLNRECEPNLVTRDVGRMMFGMDFQCAQCHDHPIVDDYFQADYYGLFAFVMRSSVFADAAKKVTLVAEKADGEASFKSVFTGNAADKVVPKLPKGATLVGEPTFAKGKEYEVAPAKGVRGIPKFSRRSQLGGMLAESREFRRNMANRLWAQMFGRGLVHPVDFHYLANPPSHPELLTLLADELATSKFDARAMLRELALTRAYQRTCDAPNPADLNLPPAAELIAKLEARRSELTALGDAQRAAYDRAKNDRKSLLEQFDKQKGELAKLETAAKTANDAVAKIETEKKSADEALAKKQEQATLVSNAAVRTSVPVKKFPDDKVVAEAFAKLDGRAKALAAEVEAETKKVADLAAKLKTAAEVAQVAQQALAQAQAAAPQDKLVAAEKAVLDAEDLLADARYAMAALDAQIVTAQAIGEWQAKKDDPALAEPAYQTLIDRWTVAGQIGRLRPLTSEQFAFSLMQASGILAGQAATFRAAAEKSWPATLKDVPEAGKPAALADYVEQKVYEAVRGSIASFVSLYGTLPGADFQATVNQALFFENGSVVYGWVSPAAGTLTERLGKLEDHAAIADEMYLAVLTRQPTADEKESVATFLKDRTDRPAAVAEMIWALASSNEFRFNH
ncbi:MAG: DUF1549 domain-containing protein [Pirellulaceae bacterium]|nr:DUF1549 domain-containing protein [Pirellulaceae bacterium]